jgi:hypothetical protein
MLLFLLASVGLTLLLNVGTILDPIKSRLPAKIVKVLQCPQCAGFWSGVIVGLRLDPVPAPFLPVRLVAYNYGTADQYQADFSICCWLVSP